MKQFGKIPPLIAAITCLWLAGCSKPRDAASREGPISTDSGSTLVPMKIKWTPGKRYEKQFSVNHSAHMNVPDMPKPMDQAITLVHSFSIDVLKALPDGGNEMEMTFTGEKMESKMDGRTDASFDSNDDPKEDAKNPAGAMIRKFIGAHINYQTDADGKVTKILNYPEFLAQVSGPKRDSQEMARILLSEDMIKKMATPGSMLPDKPVKIGDHWPVHAEFGFGMMGTFLLDLKYTFRGWQQHDGHKCAVLGFTGEITKKPGAGPGGMNFDFAKSTAVGDTWFDPETGMVMDSVNEQSINVKMKNRSKSFVSTMKEKFGNKLLDIVDIPK